MTDPVVDGVPTSGFLRGNIIQTSEGVLKTPTNIIQNIYGAKALYLNARGESLKRNDLYAGIEGLLAGNPPYNPAELAKYKLSHITNFNNLDARALYERGALAYWNLLNEAQYLVKFDIRRTSLTGKATGAQLVQYAETMSMHWDAVVRSWPSFNTVFNTLTGQLVKFGISPAIWPDERDWRWRTVELNRFFIEDQAQADTDLLTYVCLETVFTAQWLCEIYEEYKDTPKDKNPWNIDSLANLLVYLANTFNKSGASGQNGFAPYYDMMDIQRRIQNGDMSYGDIFTDSIRMVTLLYKEYDGKVSNYMFHPLYDDGHFPYFCDRQYKTMGEALKIFTASPGEFTIHSNRGLGHKIYSGAQAMMQLDCAIVDMARMSSTPLIKTLATGTKDFEAIRFYPGVPTHMGQAEFVQNQLGENISQLIGASQYINSKMQANLTNSGDDPSMPDKSLGSVSPTEARMKSYKEFSVLKNNIAHFYSQFDDVVRNMTIKLLNSKKGYPGYEYAEEWKERCLQDGVPEIIFAKKTADTFYGLPSHIKVRATRVAGDGSMAAKIMGLQELQFLVPSMGPNEAREYKREYISTALGNELVDALSQDSDIDEGTSNGASLAGVENAIMQLGQSPIFSPDNENRSHFLVHLALGNNVIQKIQQQQSNAVEADKIFVVLIPHMGEHWKMLSQDIFAEGFVSQHKAAWGELTNYATLNHHNAAKEIQAQIEKQQQMEAKNQQVLNDEQLKNLQVTSDIARNDRKAEVSNARADRESDNRYQLAKDDIQKKADNKRLEVSLNAGVKRKATLDEQNAEVVNTPLPELRQELSDINGSSPAPYNIE